MNQHPFFFAKSKQSAPDGFVWVGNITPMHPEFTSAERMEAAVAFFGDDVKFLQPAYDQIGNKLDSDDWAMYVRDTRSDRKAF